jgi:hypothetical protein
VFQRKQPVLENRIPCKKRIEKDTPSDGRVVEEVKIASQE